MKRFNSPIPSLVIAVGLATVLSCSDADEKPVAVTDSDLTGSSVQTHKKVKTNAKTGNPVFDGTEGDALDLKTAKTWKQNFKDKKPDEIRAHYFGSDIIRQILEEEGSVGIRIYYALDETGEKKLLIVGVDAEGNDLLPSELEGGKDDGENVIADYSFPCPDYCSDKE